MTIIIFLFFIFCISGISFAKEGTFFKDHLSIDKTTNIKGIFVILIFIRHYLQYVDLQSSYDNFAKCLNSALGQLIVTMFLFYSGYGVMKKIQKKGLEYIHSLPKKAFRLLLHFDLAVSLFLLLGIIFRSSFTLKQILLSFLCWDSIGNSNWYILAVISLYLMTYVSFLLFAKKGKYLYSLSLLIILCVLYICTLSIWKDAYWYNTILCYPLGVFYCLYEQYIEKFVMKKECIYWGCILLLLYGYYKFFTLNTNVWFYSGWAISFSLLVVVLTMKIQIQNNLLHFFGSHVFSLYILQRLPMSVLKHITNISRHPYFCFVVSFICTIFIALIFDEITTYMDQKCKKDL